MKTRLFASLIAGALVLGGCTLPTTPGGGTANGGTQAGTGGGANLSGLFTVGRKWEYAFNASAAGTTQTGTMGWEVIQVDATEATLKVTTQIGSMAATTTESKVKLNDSNAYANMGQDANKTMTAGPTTVESVTVPAGTFAAAKKTVYTLSDPQAEGTVTTWVDDSVGLVKSVTQVKPKMEAIPALPAGMNFPGMPAGGLDLSSTSTMELKVKP